MDYHQANDASPYATGFVQCCPTIRKYIVKYFFYKAKTKVLKEEKNVTQLLKDHTKL